MLNIYHFSGDNLRISGEKKELTRLAELIEQNEASEALKSMAQQIRFKFNKEKGTQK